MDGLLLIYALTISLEFVLSLVMALALFIVLAPRGNAEHPPVLVDGDERPARFSPTVAGSLRDAFDTVSRGTDDMATIAHARHMLAKALREQEREPERG